MRGSCHVPAALYQVRNWYQLNRRLGGPQSQTGRFGENNSWTYRDSNPESRTEHAMSLDQIHHPQLTTYFVTTSTEEYPSVLRSHDHQFTAFHGTPKYLVVSQKAATRQYPETDQSSQQPSTIIFNIHLNISPLTQLLLAAPRSSFPWDFHT